METVTLGRTGLSVCRNGFGALPIQRIGVDIAFVRAFPAGAEYARLRQYALVT